MGLDTSHDCWHGSYGAFMRWRTWLAQQIGLPLSFMEGFCDYVGFDEDDVEKIGEAGLPWPQAGHASFLFRGAAALPIPWSIIADPLKVLLHHSDCGGRIHWYECKPLAMRLARLYRDCNGVPGAYKGGEHLTRGVYDGMLPATLRFIRGLMEAHRAHEDVMFQ